MYSFYRKRHKGSLFVFKYIIIIIAPVEVYINYAPVEVYINCALVEVLRLKMFKVKLLC